MRGGFVGNLQTTGVPQLKHLLRRHEIQCTENLTKGAGGGYGDATSMILLSKNLRFHFIRT